MKSYFNYIVKNIQTASDDAKSRKVYFLVRNTIQAANFKDELLRKSEKDIPDFLEYHLRNFVRQGGNYYEWIFEVEKEILFLEINEKQRDALRTWIEQDEENKRHLNFLQKNLTNLTDKKDKIHFLNNEKGRAEDFIKRKIDYAAKFGINPRLINPAKVYIKEVDKRLQALNDDFENMAIELLHSDIVEINENLEKYFQNYTGKKSDFIEKAEYAITLKLKDYHRQKEQLKLSVFQYTYDEKSIKADKCFKWIEKKKAELDKLTEKDTTKRANTTYQWQGNSKIELPLLYKKMIGKFIASETTLKQFTAIFTGQPIDDSLKPIEWIEAKSLLAYFIDQIFELGKIPDNTNFWSIAKFSFFNADTLKHLKDSYKKNNSCKPKGFSKIDRLFENL